ncbi:hypothetical protein, partial [Bacillus pumilus]|uniref:hypothetical protein n=1 Tax=Bacillus pumilus TaxID=1408 RepID=UPI001C931238
SVMEQTTSNTSLHTQLTIHFNNNTSQHHIPSNNQTPSFRTKTQQPFSFLLIPHYSQPKQSNLSSPTIKNINPNSLF